VIDARRETADPAGPFVLRLRDTTRADALERCMALLVRIGHPNVVVDLAFRETLDADALSVLKRGGERLRACGGGLAVVCRTASLRRLLDLTLLTQSFSVHASRSEARAALAAHTGYRLERGR
jgi:anti-anti-sigma regulatory factor